MGSREMTQDEEIQYWKLLNKAADAKIALLEANNKLKEFENSIDYEK